MDKKTIKNNINKAINNDPLKDKTKKVSLFGSYVYDIPRKESDVDVLVEFIPSAKVGFFTLAKLQRRIKRALKKILTYQPQMH